MMRKVYRVLRIWTLLICLWAASGCALVPQMEREYMSYPIMQFESDKDEAHLERHIRQTLHGDDGGSGAAGGGCGCAS